MKLRKKTCLTSEGWALLIRKQVEVVPKHLVESILAMHVAHGWTSICIKISMGVGFCTM